MRLCDWSILLYTLLYISTGRKEGRILGEDTYPTLKLDHVPTGAMQPIAQIGRGTKKGNRSPQGSHVGIGEVWEEGSTARGGYDPVDDE